LLDVSLMVKVHVVVSRTFDVVTRGIF
jgi:hypothetical protein